MSDLLLFRAIHSDTIKKLILRSGQSIISAVNIDTEALLDDWSSDIKFVRYRDYLSTEELNQVGIDSLFLAQNWYKINGNDLTLIKGLSFGQYIDYEMKRLLTVACLHIAFLEKYKPTRIFMADDGTLISLITKAYADKRCIPLFVESADKFWSNQINWCIPEQKKSNLVKNTIKKILCTIAQPRSKQHISSLNFFVQSHQYTESFIDLILKRTNHRIIFQDIIKKYIGHPRTIFSNSHATTKSSDTGDRFRQLWDSLDDSLQGSDSFNYHHINLWPVIRDLSFNEFAHSWDELYNGINYYEPFLKKYNVDVIMVMQDQASIEKLLVMLASKLGITSICFQHGIEFFVWGYPGTNADLQATFGESYIDFIKKITITNKTVPMVPIGEDSMGHIKDRIKKINRSTLYKKLELKNALNKNILFISDPYVNLWTTEEPSNQNIILKQFCRAASELKEANIIVRFHPSVRAYERIEPKLEIVKYFNKGNIFIDDCLTLEESLALSDVVVVGSSTVGMQAIAAGKPLIIYDPFREDPVRYVEDCAGAAAFSEDELLSILHRVLTDKKNIDEICRCGQVFIRNRVLGYGDGKACERLLSAITELYKSRQEVIHLS